MVNIYETDNENPRVCFVGWVAQRNKRVKVEFAKIGHRNTEETVSKKKQYVFVDGGGRTGKINGA